MEKKQMLKEFINAKPDEKLLFSKALDQAFLCAHKYRNTFTDFLDPVKSHKFGEIIQAQGEINVTLFGGAEGCERQMIGFSPLYGDLNEADFPIEALEIRFDKKYGGNLTHRDFLGSVLGVGVNRELVGDIFIFESRALVFVSSEIAAFLSGELQKVRNTGVRVVYADRELIFAPLENYKALDITVASLRLDAVISAAFQVSREKAARMIAADKALINWTAAKNGAAAIKSGDVITLRGYGRAVVSTVYGATKKDRIHIKINKMG